MWFTSIAAGGYSPLAWVFLGLLLLGLLLLGGGLITRQRLVAFGGTVCAIIGGLLVFLAFTHSSMGQALSLYKPTLASATVEARQAPSTRLWTFQAPVGGHLTPEDGQRLQEQLGLKLMSDQGWRAEATGAGSATVPTGAWRSLRGTFAQVDEGGLPLRDGLAPRVGECRLWLVGQPSALGQRVEVSCPGRISSATAWVLQSQSRSSVWVTPELAGH